MLDLDSLKLASLSQLRLSVDELTCEPRVFFPVLCLPVLSNFWRPRYASRAPLDQGNFIEKIQYLDFHRNCCWGLVLKCYESRTRQHRVLNVNVLRPTKHYSFGD
jgi:hypothetical protein